MPVAATFGWEFEDGSSLGQLARLDTLVTVVDCSTFLTEIARGEALADRDMSAGDGHARSIADLLVDQVEFADVILLNKTDLVSSSTPCRPRRRYPGRSGAATTAVAAFAARAADPLPVSRTRCVVTGAPD